MADRTAERVSLLSSSSAAATRVFTTILTRGPLSRIEIARLTGLSQAAVTKAVAPLAAAGLVVDAAGVQRDGLPGRPATPVAVVPGALTLLGVKVTADELVGVATDLTTRVLTTHRMPLDSHEESPATDAIVRMCEALRHRLGDRASTVVGVGVAVSGDVDAVRGIVRESAIMGWSGVPLGAGIAERVGLPVRIENDVRALTIGEHWFGVGVGTASFAIVTIGRGVGSGLHLNGKVVEGAYGVAGEIGHLPLVSPEHVCPCGRRGCVEAVAATPAVAAAVSRAHGREVPIEEAVALARSADPAAVAAFRVAGEATGAAIATLVNLTGPELVIIGGEAVSEVDLFGESLRRAFREHAFGAASRCRIVIRPHRFEDWARGAAAALLRSVVARAREGESDRTGR